MSDQETHGRFTAGAWNLMKSAVPTLTEEENVSLCLMIETKTETITLEEVQAMLYVVVRESN